jgi:hypothetical protein
VITGAGGRVACPAHPAEYRLDKSRVSQLTIE